MSEINSISTINILELYNLILKKIEDKTIDFEKDDFNSIFDPFIEEYKNILNKPKKSFFIKKKSTKMNQEKDNELFDLENYFIKTLRDNMGDIDYIYKLLTKINKTQEDEEQYYSCEYCKGTNFINSADNARICDDCGFQINVYMYTVENVGFNQLQHINLNQKYKYEKICHFKDTVNQFQTKQNKFIPEKIFTELEEMIEKHGLKINNGKNRKEIYSKITKQHIRKFLSETSNNKYYEDVQLFYCKLTDTTPPDISHLERNLYEDFELLVDAFLKISSNTNRKNFLNSQYVLKQLLRRYNYEVKDDDLNMLKTPNRIREHDEIYEKCCEILNWNFQAL